MNKDHASENDTIFAAASGFGRAAVCVIRISGPQSRTAIEALAGTLPTPRRLVLRSLRDPTSSEPLDQALVAWLPGPRSFTGEDQAELHIHGGLATRAAVLRVLGALAGCRPAEAGEFTRRAFLNGRMDLSQVEGLADVIDAETEAQRRQAMRQLDGNLGSIIETWREELLDILALLEASLDFSDEGDVPDALEEQAEERLVQLHAALMKVLDNRTGERVRDGFTVVLAGAPNAGKSTLLNALARRDVAIVSPTAGTTRDVIEVHCDLGGLPVVIVDTAGIRESEDAVEREGVSRARARVASADLVLWLIAPEDERTPSHEPPDGHVLTVATKVDLTPAQESCDCAISAATGEGLPELLAAIERAALAGLGQGDAVLTRQRHREALEQAASSINQALARVRGGDAVELAAEDVRLATRAIGRITGRVDVDHLLDKLFATFCIGK
jgi:tRNA modification GTPase